LGKKENKNPKLNCSSYHHHHHQSNPREAGDLDQLQKMKTQPTHHLNHRIATTSLNPPTTKIKSQKHR
jgi:hypothetical protein